MDRLKLLEMAIQNAKERIDDVAALSDSDFTLLKKKYKIDSERLNALTVRLLQNAIDEAKAMEKSK